MHRKIWTIDLSIKIIDDKSRRKIQTVICNCPIENDVENSSSRKILITPLEIQMIITKSL